MRFDAKFLELKERSDLENVSMDELHGILTTYAMRTEQKNPSKREAAFTAYKKAGKNKKQSKPNPNGSGNVILDEEIANFVRKLKRGRSKYKGKLPLKCFNCGEIGHFSSKVSLCKELR